MKLNEKMELKFLCGALAALVALAGCSTKEELDTHGEIRLGVANATRAAVDSFEGLQGIGNNIGIFGVKTVAHTSDVGADWTDAAFSETTPDAGGLIMNNVQTSSIDADGSIHWTGTYYYPLDENSGVKFCAYHPFTTDITAPAAGQAPVANFKLTGAEDLMYAAPVVGWRTKNSETDGPTNLDFKHVLTQLTFVLSDPEGNFAGKKLTNIKFLEANTTGKMNIETGAIADWATPTDLSVSGLGEGVEITAAAKVSQAITGAEIMLQPGQASFPITVTMGGNEYKNITIQPTAPATTFEAGKSYKITLTFKERVPIGVSASVQPWVDGGTGFAEVM